MHRIHGVGRYTGIVHRELAGSERDYLVLEYAKGDKLYVPSDAVGMVARYIGGDVPRVHRMGGTDWARATAKVKRAVRDMAGELVRLYTVRMSVPGYAFAPDTPWQRELEDAFPFEETPDQLRVIEDVKRDMERPIPMDRLLCGDVGFGKTEVAVRAACKAVMSGKQVAVLVPTTLLAEQHLLTFRERFAPYPVTVRMLSRFVDADEQDVVIGDLAAGKVDIVIGTHRLLGSDVRFADLGLLVVDEEQRFGVSHKERLKKMRAHVDVLTMTATPIPRTLEMALAGIRQMSTIDTPPEDRQPVRTFVGSFDDDLAVGAVASRAAARGTGLLGAQPGRDDRPRGGAAPGPDARRSDRRGARADGRGSARAPDGSVLGARRRHPGLHHDHRVGPGRAEREHAHRRSCRHARVGAALSAARAGGSFAPSARSRTSSSRSIGR